MNVCPVYKGNEDCRITLNGRAKLCASCRVKEQKDTERLRPKRPHGYRDRHKSRVSARQDYAYLIDV